MRKIIPGSGDKSYGLHVAKMAGIPKSIIKRANVILENHIKSSEKFEEGKNNSKMINQNLLFEIQEKKITEEINKLDTDSTTPLEALQFLIDLKLRYKNE